MARLCVLHLVGSPTNSFFADLSLLYASECLNAVAEPARYDTHIAYVGPDGRWRFPQELSHAAIAGARAEPLDSAVARIRALAPDVAVPQMFCLAGMTTYRALLDLMHVPFVGNEASIMALGANKARSRAVVASAGVLVPEANLLSPGDLPTLRPPVVVKPVDSDNSVGVTLVRTEGDLAAALSSAFAQSHQVLVERYVDLGREVRCGVLDRAGELLVLPLEEYAVDTQTKPIRGVDDKLVRRSDGQLTLVAKDATHAWIVDPADPVTERVMAAARTSHRALGCRHHSLFDFRLDPDGQPWFLEAGLYCSFAPNSVIAMMAAAAGITLEALFADALGQALADHPGRGDDACVTVRAARRTI